MKTHEIFFNKDIHQKRFISNDDMKLLVAYQDLISNAIEKVDQDLPFNNEAFTFRCYANQYEEIKTEHLTCYVLVTQGAIELPFVTFTVVLDAPHVFITGQYFETPQLIKVVKKAKQWIGLFEYQIANAFLSWLDDKHNKAKIIH